MSQSTAPAPSPAGATTGVSSVAGGTTTMRPRVGVPPVRTNSFMARHAADPAVGSSKPPGSRAGAGASAGVSAGRGRGRGHGPSRYAAPKADQARAAGAVTPVRRVTAGDSDTEDEQETIRRAVEASVVERPPKLNPRQFEDSGVDTEYNNVSVEDIERRLKDSFVYEVERPKCTEMRLTIDPRGEFMKKWDVLMMGLIIYVAIVTPFEIGFLEETSGFLLILNRIIDALFGVDLVVNFFLGYFDEHGQWEFDNKKIALHYLTGWFVIDFLSVIPFSAIADLSGSDTVDNLKILRLVRLLRLIKLTRVIRASRLVKRWEMGTDVSYSTIGMTKHLVVTAVSTHWVTCLLHLVTSLEAVEENWVTVDMEIGTLRDEPTFGLYTAAFYAAVQALPMGVPNSVVPVTTWERVSSIFAMLFLGSIYAYVIGSICDVVANLDPATNEFQNNMDTLNRFMEEKAIPQAKRQEIREYFHHCKSLFRQKFYHVLLEQMSPKMRGDTALHMHGGWLREIPFFQASDPDERREFTTAVALALEPMAFAPKELLIRIGEFTERMYIIQRGLVARMGRVLGAGRFVGEDVILHNSRRKYFVRVLTYLDVYALSKEKLEEILDNGDFPDTYKTIRRAAIRLALTRELCRISDQVRLAKMLRSANTAGDHVSVNQILAVSSAKRDEASGLDMRGTEVVPDKEVPEQRRRKASQAAVSSVEMRMLRLEHHLSSLKDAMKTTFARHGAVL